MRALIWLLAWAVWAYPVPATGKPLDPFATLRAAYLKKDPAMAADAYTEGARLVFRYSGSPEEQHMGRSAIMASYRDFFAQFGPDRQLDLNFRVLKREGNKTSGLYRLRISGAGASFGTFDARLAADGRFDLDISGSADLTAFEEAAGPVVFSPEDEDLDAAYYDSLTGRYLLPDGCKLIVTRSVVRLFVRNECTQDWRGLNRSSGRSWTAGDRVISPLRVAGFAFAPIESGKSAAMDIDMDAGGTTVRAERDDIYRVEDVSFAASDGTMLAATLYLPNGAAGRRPATVMVHGSGPQDRNGYASIIAVMADAFAASGRVVLTYDKRGIGGSGGDWSRAGFDVLAGDSLAAIRYLAGRPEVDPARVGLAGSSQAGWVVAAALARAPNDAADVFLLGAAGTALTVEEQNLYNTEARMGCAGIAEEDIALALEQQRAFFSFLADKANARRLDELTREAQKRPSLAGWLFPDSRAASMSTDAWYMVLDPRFDPLPVWRNYAGEALFVFAELDDSTPSKIALKRLVAAHPATVLLKRSQHLGLAAESMCAGELGDVSRFAPELFDSISRFAAQARPGR